MPKVSVIIPAYNAMTYLPKTVESVLRQTFTNIEVLIINDGSSDYVVQWASQQLDSRMKLISQENQGLSAARNTGIAKAQGEYIAFVDADDLWAPTKLEKQVRCLDNEPAVGLVHTWMVLVDECGKSTGRVMISNVEGEVWKQVVVQNVIACPSVMVRRCCFETVGVFDRNLCSVEDWDMWIRIASRYPLAVIKEPLAYYRQLPSSMSKNRQVMEKAFHLVIEKAFNSVPSELMYLKNRSYSHANVCLAWKSLQSSDKNYKEAVCFLQQALIHYPQLRYSGDYIRLSLNIMLIQWLGIQRYDKALPIFQSLRRRLSNIV